MSDRPSTLGGPGWVDRRGSHAEDVARGLWGAFGVRDEVSPLREVLLTWPGEELRFAEPPGQWLMNERPDLERIQAQARGVEAALMEAGVQVRWIRPGAQAVPTGPSRRPPPNLIFARDLYVITPEGAVLARLAPEQRAGEERFAAEALAALGVPILATPTGRATFEGADALWMNPRAVLVGVGRRTNAEGFALLERVLGAQGVETIPVEVPDTAQHLLGSLIFVDHDLALCPGATPSALRALERGGVRAEPFALDEEVAGRRALNLITLAPREVLMPAGNPRTRARLEALGVRCREVEVGEYVKAAGALGCLVGVLRRG